MDREKQMKEVQKIIAERNQIHPDVIQSEVDWFFNKMGIDAYYFRLHAHTIAEHIQTLYAWKVLHETELEDNKNAEVRFGFERKESAMFACRSDTTFDSKFSPNAAGSGLIEQLIEGRYFLEGYRSNVYLGKYMDQRWRMQSYRTKGSISEHSSQQLRMYFLNPPTFPAGELAPGETNIEKLADVEFTARASKNTKDIYQNILTEAISRPSNLGPIIRVYPSTYSGATEEARLVCAYQTGTTHSFFSSLTTLYDKERLYARKKAVETFKNNWVIISIHLRALGDLSDPARARTRVPDVMAAARVVAQRASFNFVLPRTALTPLLLGTETSPAMNVEEVTYLFAAWKFSCHFVNRHDEEYYAILASVQGNAEVSRHLQSLKASLREGAFSEARLLSVFQSEHLHPTLRKLYDGFRRRHDPKVWKKGDEEADAAAMRAEIIKVTRSMTERETLLAVLSFNQHIRKTNFFKPGKVALAFRLDPGFLAPDNFAVKPYGVFFFLGAEFRGFHVRFSDIARGGLRLIKSRDFNEYSKNAQGLFEENYNLALTQQRKNKDIPEGGSKGTILLTVDHQHGRSGEVAFMKYIDAMMDLLLVDPAHTVDHLGQPEILFCGPDENTAPFMDMAAYHAGKRGYKYWRAFTTGKSINMGGIPHDMFGMTTRSVHQYVLGVLRKRKQNESDVTKFCTGGPDGDLGSNEVLISQDKTVGIVDGSGVLFDKTGLDRTELARLAKGRLMIKDFDRSKLSPEGRVILLEDRDVELPDGTKVANGLMFRNTFHLSPMARADFFVPCGGRPNSVTIHNYKSLLDEGGVSRFGAIVEGANLFFTQDARLKLEEAGAVVFKDASTNKGGVTSSSCEVLACLALDDADHAKHMQVPGNDPSRFPAFYKEYVKSVQDVIENNARLEFELIWREHEKSGTPRCVLSDMVSAKINRLNGNLANSNLWDKAALRRKVVAEACPKTLVDLLGVDKIVERVPVAYLRAIFGAYLASRYVYEYGLDATEFDFFDFISKFTQETGSKL